MARAIGKRNCEIVEHGLTSWKLSYEAREPGMVHFAPDPYWAVDNPPKLGESKLAKVKVLLEGLNKAINETMEKIAKVDAEARIVLAPKKDSPNLLLAERTTVDRVAEHTTLVEVTNCFSVVPANDPNGIAFTQTGLEANSALRKELGSLT